jgi:CRP-like cAMP-binding protein
MRRKVPADDESTHLLLEKNPPTAQQVRGEAKREPLTEARNKEKRDVSPQVFPQKSSSELGDDDDDDAAWKRGGVVSSSTNREHAFLMKIFSEHDRRHRGSLNLQEVINAMRAAGYPVSERHVVELLAELPDRPLQRSSAQPVLPISSGFLDTIRRSVLQVVRGGPGNRIIAEVNFKGFRRLVNMWCRGSMFLAVEHHHQHSRSGGASLPSSFPHRLRDELGARSTSHLAAALVTTHILPDSSFGFAWQVVMVMVATYFVIQSTSLHLFDEFGLVRALATTTLPDLVAALFCAADVALNFFFATRVKKGSVPDVIDKTEMIRQLYLSSWWIWVDTIAAVPFRFAFVFGGDAQFEPSFDASGRLVMGRTGCSWCTDEKELRVAVEVAKWLSHIRIIKYMRLLSYFHRTGHAPVTKLYVLSQYVVGRGLLTLSRFACLVHLSAIGYLTLPLSSSYASGGQIIESSRPHYAQGIFIVLYCFSTVGYGSVEATSEALMYYFIFLVVIGAVVDAYVVANVVEFLNRSDVESERRRKMVEANALLAYFKVPKGLANELLAYQHHLLSSNLVIAHGHAVDALPADFREKLNLYTRACAVRVVPFLADLHSSVKLELCEALMQVVCVPDEALMQVNDQGEEMLVVNHGFLDVHNEAGEYVHSFHTGCFFGELAAMARRPVRRVATVRAISYCDLFVLTQHAFGRVMRRFPTLRQRVCELLPRLQARQHGAARIDAIDYDLSHLMEGNVSDGSDADDKEADDDDDDDDDDHEREVRNILGQCSDHAEALMNREWFRSRAVSLLKQKLRRRQMTDATRVSSTVINQEELRRNRNDAISRFADEERWDHEDCAGIAAEMEKEVQETESLLEQLRALTSVERPR